MAFQIPEFPIGTIGGEYIHTNIVHFHRSLGSFGDPRGRMEIVFEGVIKKQEDREKQIDKQLKNFGSNMTIDQFVAEMNDMTELINEGVKGGAEGFKPGSIARASHTREGKTWSKAEIQYALNEHVVPYINGTNDLIDNIVEKTGIALKDIETALPGITKHRESLESFINQYTGVDITKEDNVSSVISKTIGGLKGIGWEGIMSSVAYEILHSFKISGHQVELTGALTRSDGRKVKADGVVRIPDWNTTFGISMKATRMKDAHGQASTFLNYGTTLHSGSVQSIANYMNRSLPTISKSESDRFKYFLINLSRMKDYSQARYKPMSSPTSVNDYPEYKNLLDSIAKTYATFFIGDELLGEDSELFNVDVLVLGDAAFKKSTILNYIKDGKMKTKFKLGKRRSQDKEYWLSFDDKKRKAMIENEGDYKQVQKERFMQDSLRMLLAQPVTVNLRGFAKYF